MNFETETRNRVLGVSATSCIPKAFSSEQINLIPYSIRLHTQNTVISGSTERRQWFLIN